MAKSIPKTELTIEYNCDAIHPRIAPAVINIPSPASAAIALSIAAKPAKRLPFGFLFVSSGSGGGGCGGCGTGGTGGLGGPGFPQLG